MSEKKKKGPVDRFWELMDSMKFAVGLLIVLTAVSVAGVLLPQFPPSGFTGTLEELYLSKYGDLAGGFLTMLGMHHVFTVWWYYLLLLLLCLNLTVCSFRRLGTIVAAVKKEDYLEGGEKYRRQSNNRSMALPLDPAGAASLAEKVLVGEGYRVSSRSGSGEGVHLLYARRGAWSQFGPFLTHISMVLIIVGAAISYMLSFDHFQWMGRGDVIEVPELGYMASPAYQLELVGDRIASAFGIRREPSRLRIADRVVRNHDWRNLPEDFPLETAFRLRLERFEARFTPQGKPKAYLSTVSVLGPDSGGEPEFSHLIKVNDPLIHEGVYFYQSSYSPGGGGARSVQLSVASNDSAAPGTWNLAAVPGGPALPLGGTGDSLRVTRFVGSFRLGQDGRVASEPGEDTNPAVEVVVTRGGEELVRQWVFRNFPNFSHSTGNPYAVRMGEYEKSYLTGLMIRTHRSQTVIWIGFAMMVLGVILSFYINYRQYWVMAEPDEKGSRLWLAGASYKWKQPFLAEFRETVEKIRDSREE